MRCVRLGSLDASVVGLGCNAFGGPVDQSTANQMIGTALDAGVTFFDTSDSDGGGDSEILLGRALRSRRGEAILATKFGAGDGISAPSGAGGPTIRAAVEGSLRRLGTDHIDLYQVHVPDPAVPIGETLAALGQLVREGKVVEVGCSNFSAAQIDEAATCATEDGTPRFVTIQNQLSLLRRAGEAELLSACSRNDASLLPYSPLANGLLTGKYRRGEAVPDGTRLAGWSSDQATIELSPAKFDVLEALEAHATSRGRTLLELAVSWLAGLPGMGSIIAGATTPDQVRSNAAAAGWDLTDEERGAIDRIAPGVHRTTSETISARLERLVEEHRSDPVILEAVSGVVTQVTSSPSWASTLGTDAWPGTNLPDLQPLLESRLEGHVHLAHSQEPDGVMHVTLRSDQPLDALAGVRIVGFPPSGDHEQIVALFPDA